MIEVRFYDERPPLVIYTPKPSDHAREDRVEMEDLQDCICVRFDD